MQREGDSRRFFAGKVSNKSVALSLWVDFPRFANLIEAKVYWYVCNSKSPMV